MGDEEITLILDDGSKLRCSKQTLEKSSHYFHAMFSLGFSESNQNEVNLHGALESTAVQELLGQAKGFQLNLNDDNVFQVLQAAGMLQFESARETCCDFLKHAMGPSNLLKIFSMADLLGEVELRKLSLQKIIWSFVSTVTQGSSYWCELTHDLVKELVSHPNVRISSEMEIFAFILQWIDFDTQERGHYFSDLFQHVRLDDLDVQDLSDLLNYHHVSESEQIINIIQSLRAQKVQLNQELISTTSELEPEQAGAKSKKIEKSGKRGPLYLPCVVAQIDNQHWIMSYDSRTNSLDRIVKLDKVTMGGTVFASGYQAVAAGPMIYVIGGEFMLGRSNWNKAVWCYDTISEQWTHQLTLDIQRRHFSTCLSLPPPGSHNGGEIFIVGGFGKHRIILDLMDSIDLNTNQLQEHPVLSIPMYSPAVCHFKGRIFVMKNSIHSFHIEQNFWSMHTNFNMPKDVEFKTAMATSDHIYLTANHKSLLYRFDPDQTSSEKREKLDIELVGRFSKNAQNVCLIEERGIIYNFSDDEKPSIEIYNTNTKEFKIVWEAEVGFIEFSPNYSLGCFPLASFN